jgi:ketosteroid isomerase-like protein
VAASSDTQQRNVELTRLGFEAYNAGDYEALVKLLDPDVELHSDNELINGGDYRGHEGFMRWNAEWIEVWEEFTIEPRSLETFGGHVILADTHQVARGAGSGVDVEMNVYWVFELAEDQVVRMHLYASRERALAAIDRWRSERESGSAA